MIKICTSIEQSKKLLSLGLDPSTADMCYVGAEKEHILHAESYNKILAWRKEDAKKYHNAPFSTSITPCWSLAAILELMPFFITIKEEGEPDEYYHFQLKREGSVFRSKWLASYHGLKTERGKVHTRIVHWAVGPKGESDTPIDAAFEMVCWLIEQGYIKVNK
jgi:hypothetical protein